MTARRAVRALAAAAIVAGVGSITTAAALSVRAPTASRHVPGVGRAPAVTATSVVAGRAGPRAAGPPPTAAPARPPAAGHGAAETTAPVVATAVHAALLRPPAAVTVGGETAAIIPVGVLPGGELQLPDDPTMVGWWASSGMVGAPSGSIVLAGHVDSRRYGPGTFAALHTAEPGDIVHVLTADGVEHRYAVATVEQTPKAALPTDLLATTGPHRLVLITCGGEFDDATRHYDDNVIVVATAI